MVSPPTILHLKNQEIDRSKWNECIRLATNTCPYAYSEYLDALCPNWEALILEDYRWVMPLPIKKKYGIRYLYQPFLIPYLGLFGQNIDATLVKIFIDAIPSKFKWVDITLNPATTDHFGSNPITDRTNFVLSLKDDYTTLRSNYRSNHIRNLQRSEKMNFLVDRSVAPERIFELAEKHLGPQGHFPSLHKQSFLTLIKNWQAAGKAICYGIRLQDRLLASAIFLIDEKRAYYLVVGNHPDGKTVGASHSLINAFIQDHAGRDILLDFEGSDVPSLAFFYEGFGSRKEKFGWLRINRLPRWIAWLKA
jgi:hypothetical protein